MRNELARADRPDFSSFEEGLFVIQADISDAYMWDSEVRVLEQPSRTALRADLGGSIIKIKDAAEPGFVLVEIMQSVANDIPIMTSTQRFQAIGQPTPTLEMSWRWPSIQEYPTMRITVAWRTNRIQIFNERKITAHLHENDTLEVLLGGE